MDRTIPRDRWVAALKEFTERNAGRRTALEEDAPDYGAQPEEAGYPLRGISFDPRDGRIEIMLGDQFSVDRHLTRAISGPQGIDLVRDERGRDAALRIRHDADGQTVLRILHNG